MKNIIWTIIQLILAGLFISLITNNPVTCHLLGCDNDFLYLIIGFITTIISFRISFNIGGKAPSISLYILLITIASWILFNTIKKKIKENNLVLKASGRRQILSLYKDSTYILKRYHSESKTYEYGNFKRIQDTLFLTYEIKSFDDNVNKLIFRDDSILVIDENNYIDSNLIFKIEKSNELY